MSKVLIKNNPDFVRQVEEDNDVISVAELFGNTIQGEGINIGIPATFLRVQGCTLNCGWCDSESVWRFGNNYTFDEICQILEENDLIEKFKSGQHLVLTGGSPLRQQRVLSDFIEYFIDCYNFKPYIEIENECVLNPIDQMISYVDCWNNSPKLASSGNTVRTRYSKEVLKQTSQLHNSWFKFVVSSEADWREIESDFLNEELIQRSQIILMPEGATQEELKDTREIAIEIAIRESVRFSDREHIIAWDKKTGV